MGMTSFLDNINPFRMTVRKLESVNRNQEVALDAALSALQLARPMASQNPTGRVFIFPQYNIHPEQIYSVARNSDILRIVHNALKGEIFRNGYELSLATDTDEEVVVGEDSYDSEVAKAEPIEDEETEVVDEKPKKPDVKERKEIIDFLESCNANKQSVLEVCKQCEDDVNIIDDAFVLFLFEYKFSKGVPYESRTLREVLRVDPKWMALVLNDQDIPGMDNSGMLIMSCRSRRDEFTMVPLDMESTAMDPVTGDKLERVYYQHKGNNGKTVYYFEDEIVHFSRYFPTTRLGFSPVITLWEKVQTLMAMDIYVQQLYVGQRPPKGLLLVKTANKEGLSKAWEEMLSRVAQKPHLPGMMGVQGGGNTDKGNFAEYFDFMKSLDEMQYTDVRNEMRNQIGAFHGVSPLFQNDTSQGGGLNNEGLQLTVTNRAAERAQNDYNNKVFRALMKAMNMEHWVLRLRPSEEQDEMAKLQRIEMHLKNGGEAAAKGLQAEWDSDKGETIIKSGSFSPPMLMSPMTSASDGFGDGSEEDSPNNPESTSSGEPKKKPNYAGSPREVSKGFESFFLSRKPMTSSLESSRKSSKTSLKKQGVSRRYKNSTN